MSAPQFRSIKVEAGGRLYRVTFFGREVWRFEAFRRYGPSHKRPRHHWFDIKTRGPKVQVIIDLARDLL
jgi:hypothetical protein